jgi:hypothetical protein
MALPIINLLLLLIIPIWSFGAQIQCASVASRGQQAIKEKLREIGVRHETWFKDKVATRDFFVNSS